MLVFLNVMNIAEMWDTCIKFMWDEIYINGLDKFLKSNKVKTILDCGGGTGFPSIELKKRGWDISYCDNNKVMFENFQKKSKKEKVQIPYYFSNWAELSKKINKKFDAILCRGNSLIYASSWNATPLLHYTCILTYGPQPTVDEIIGWSKENIKSSLREFFKILNKNGLAYIDITNKKEFDKKKYPFVEEFGEKIIDGKKAKVTWELTHDYKNKLRKWKSIVVIDYQKYEFVNYSYLLRHEELVELMEEVGFKDVKKVKIEGEKNYNVFVGYK